MGMELLGNAREWPKRPSNGRANTPIAVQRVCRVRGQGVRSLLQAISARWDAETVSEILARTPETVRSNVLHADVAASGWYPVTWYGELYRACREVTGAPVEVAAELRAEALRIDARGLFRFLLRFASPRSLVENYERICGLYLDGPRIEVDFVRSNAIEVRWSNLHGYDETCVYDHVGGAVEALTLCKGRNVRFSDLEVVWFEGAFARCEAFRTIIHWD
jgi:hypothetical protein